MKGPNQADCAPPESKYHLLSSSGRTAQESSIRVFRRFIVTKIKHDGTVEMRRKSNRKQAVLRGLAGLSQNNPAKA